MARKLIPVMDHDGPTVRPSLVQRPAVLAAFGAALCTLAFAAFYPGMSNPDMTIEYVGLGRGQFSDWHPPMLAFLWWAIDPLLPGKAGLFALFTAAYAAYAFIMLLCALRVSRLTGCLVAFVLVAPCFTAQGATLYKDFLMALLLGLGAAAASLRLRPDGSTRAWLLPVALISTLIGALIRANAVFAAGPLLVSMVNRAWPYRLLRFLLLSGALAVALIPASALVNEAAFHPKKMSVLDSLLIFDFAGITHYSGDNVFPAEIRRTFTRADNEVCYSPAWWDPFISWRDFWKERFGTAEDLGIAHVVDPKFAACQQVWLLMRRAYVDRGASFTSDWLAALWRHPLAYAAHRFAHFNQSLNWLMPASSNVARTTEQPNPYGWTFEPGLWTRAVLRFANMAGSLPPSWPFVWLIAALVTFFSADQIADAPTRRLVLGLSLSGIFYTLGFLVVGLGAGYRYHVWLFLSAGVSAALAIGCAQRRGELTRLLLRYAGWTAPFVLLACLCRAFKLSPI